MDQHITADVTAFSTVLAGTESVVRPAAGWFADARADYLKFSSAQPDGGTGVDLGVVMEILKQEMADDAVLTFGAGNHALWPARYLQHNSANSLAAPRNGAMGMGIPAAVAASLAYPGRQVISVAGDGCFMMNGQEIATAMGHGARFIVLVVDNGIFATIREHQEAHYPGRPSGTHMTNPDFAALARSYGGYGERIEKAEDFAAAFRRAVESGLPAVLHLPQDPTTRSPKSN
jgi:acetolactate synthase-1/2/3 large subunit